METSIVTIQDICELGNSGYISFEVQLLRPLSLIELRESALGKKFMYQQDWYNDQPWAQAQLSVGKYVVRLPIPDSNNRTREEQSALLLPDEEQMPVTLGALTLLCLARAGYPEPLTNGAAIRCAEKSTTGEFRVALERRPERIYVRSSCASRRFDNVWAGGVRTS